MHSHNLDGLANVTSVGSVLSTQYDDVQANVNDLTGRTSAIGGATIGDDEGLTDFNEVGCSEIGGTTLCIADNAMLTSLSGLGGLTTIGGILIRNNEALTNLNGLDGISSVGHDLNRLQ